MDRVSVYKKKLTCSLNNVSHPIISKIYMKKENTNENDTFKKIRTSSICSIRFPYFPKLLVSYKFEANFDIFLNKNFETQIYHLPFLHFIKIFIYFISFLNY